MTSTIIYLTTDEMVARAGKTRDFWARLCKAKKLPGIKLGNDWRVAEVDFDAFMRGGGKATARTRYSSRQKRSA